MQIPPEVSFKNIEPSERIRDRVNKEIRRLESHYPRLTACKVVIEGGSGRRRIGDLAHVRIHLTMPGGQNIAVSNISDDEGAHHDVIVAIRDAFQAADRQLKSVKRDQQSEGTIPARMSGEVKSFLAGQPAAFIRGEDGLDHYFHAREATGSPFEGFEVGDLVTFVPDEGNKGPVARAVHKRGT